MIGRIKKILTSSLQWFVSGISEKTAWDWLDLLLVPVSLAGGVFFLENQAELRQERQAKERYDTQLQIAEDRSKQAILTSYLEAMKELLLDRNLRQAEETSEVFSVARALTTTTMTELDSERNQLLISFLRESGLLSFPSEQRENDLELKIPSVPILINLNLSRLALSNANLKFVNLNGTNLEDADLRNADLRGAVLQGTNLESADLRNADFSGASLQNANLRDADLRGAVLNDTYLLRAHLDGVDFEMVGRDESNVDGIDLRGANLADIQWDESTHWPIPEEVVQAVNVPKALQHQLGIDQKMIEDSVQGDFRSPPVLPIPSSRH